ncbi:MAG: HEAT repeat domain-containing protein [Propioniciclava sp.]
MRIGELARRTGLTVRTLRHYDDVGLLVPQERSPGDYRLYGAHDVDRLLAIQHLKSLGLSLDEIRAALDDPDFDAHAVLGRHIALVEDRLATERDLLARLRTLQSSVHAGWEDVIDAIALTERLRHPDAAVRFRAALTTPTHAPIGTVVERLRTEPEPGVREALTWSLVQHGSAAVAPVIAGLDDPDPAVRRQLAHVLSKLRDPQAVAPLERLLADPEPDVSAKAAFALGQIGGSAAVTSLVAALGAEEPLLADAVVAALVRRGSEALGPLSALVTTSRLPEVRRQAVEALAAMGDPAAIAPLVAALDDADPEVRLEALFGLAALPDEAASRAVVAARSSADARLRQVAQQLQDRKP